jgi:hypothetical protein
MPVYRLLPPALRIPLSVLFFGCSCLQTDTVAEVAETNENLKEVVKLRESLAAEKRVWREQKALMTSQVNLDQTALANLETVLKEFQPELDSLGVAKEILLFDPGNPGNWQNVANLHLRMEHEAEGMSHLEVTHSLGGGSYISRRLLGNMYFNREMVEQSAVEFTEMIKLATKAEELEDVL